MINFYTNEKWKQIIAYHFRKAICFFLFFHFGVFFSQDVYSKEISDFNYENSNYQHQVIDSCNSSIHTLGGAVIIDHTKNIEQQTTLVTNKKTVKISYKLTRKQTPKKIIAKRNHTSNLLFYQSIINKLKLFFEKSSLNYYTTFLNNNNIKKNKSILFTTVLSLFYIFLLILLKNNNFNIFSRRLFINSDHFSRPPPLFSIT